MKNRYAVINMMSAIPGDSIGIIVSRHRTYGAAEKAMAKVQRMTRKAHGSNSYLPMRIVELVVEPEGRHVSQYEVVS